MAKSLNILKESVIVHEHLGSFEINRQIARDMILKKFSFSSTENHAEIQKFNAEVSVSEK